MADQTDEQEPDELDQLIADMQKRIAAAQAVERAELPGLVAKMTLGEFERFKRQLIDEAE